MRHDKYEIRSEDSLRGRPVLASSHGPVSFSTRYNKIIL